MLRGRGRWVGRYPYAMNDPRSVLTKVLAGEGCWEWTGGHCSAGYGSKKWQGKETNAHRVVYEIMVGPIPEGLVLDHLCQNKGCVRPSHLEPVTNYVNTMVRGTSPWAVKSRATHCVHGHPLEGRNLIIRPEGGRRCRACSYEAVKRYQARKKAVSLG